MKKIIIILLSTLSLSACVSLITPTVEQSVTELKPGSYALDKSHASLIFKVKHLGLSNYVGRFNTMDATLDFDPQDMSSARLDAVIQIDSLDINNESLKNDLMGRSWFNQKKYPQAGFSTVNVIPVSESEFDFTGQLDWRGVSKPIVLRVTFLGGANNILSGKYTLGFSARGQFKRSDFGMDGYIPLVGDEIVIEADAEFLKN